jgi:hypothetical protein
MNLVILASLLAVVVWFLLRFRSAEAQRGRLFFDLAASREESGKFEDACFHYAIAANAGYRTAWCKNKVKDLWRSHGPFGFVEQLNRLKADYCRHAGCGEGFHQLTVSGIHAWVGEHDR